MAASGIERSPQPEEEKRDKQSPAARAVRPASPGPGETFSQPPEGPAPVQRSFCEEDRAEELLRECPPTALKQKEEVFSPSICAVELDGIGMIVLRDDWKVETLDSGTQLLILYKRLVPHCTSLALPWRDAHSPSR